MSRNVEKIYEYVLKLTKECGAVIKSRIRKPKSVGEKSSDVDLVTETDTEVEKRLIEGIAAKFPDHKFIGEETTASGVKPQLTAAPTWIIDPVDGTMSFVHGYPIVCVSVALLIEKTAEIGIIYNPVLEQLFTAVKGRGAFLNGSGMKASVVKDLKKSLITLEIGPSSDGERTRVVAENASILRPTVQAIRCTGSSAWNMAMVGSGGCDAYVDFGLHAWDMAAGDLIVREAGGTVIDPSGGPLDLMSCRVLCSGTESLARQLVALIKQYHPPRDA